MMELTRLNMDSKALLERLNSLIPRPCKIQTSKPVEKGER